MRLGRAGCAGAVLLAVLAGPRHAGAQQRAGGPMPDPYLVFPFENTSHAAAMNPFVTGLALSLAERLESHPGLRPAYEASILITPVRVPASADEAGKVCAGHGGRFAFLGAFERKSDWTEVQVKVSAVLCDPKGGKVIASATQKGGKDELQDLLGKAAIDLLEQISRPAPELARAEILRRQTRDPYAFYLYGKASFEFFQPHQPAPPEDPRKKAKAPRPEPKAKDEGSRLEVALKTAARTINIDPKYAEAYRLYGFLQLQDDEPGRAQGSYQHALELRPSYYQPLLGLVRMYRQKGQNAKAFDLVQRALLLRPFDSETRYLFGQSLYEQQKLDEAEKELREVTRVAPRHLGARRTLVLIHSTRGAGEELAEELEGLLALTPDDYSARLDLGSAYRRLGRPDKAISAYEQVLRTRPTHSGAIKFLGDLYRTVGEPQKATEQYQKLMKMAPSDPRPYFLVGASLVAAGEDKEAEKIFSQALRFQKYQPALWNNLGAIRYRRGDIHAALALLQKAAAKQPDRPRIRYNLGLALSAAQERGKALDELKAAAELDPNDPEPHYAMGVTLLRMGQLAEAAAEFREALARRPDHEDAQHNLALLEDLARRSGESEIVAPELKGVREPQMRN